MNERELVRRIRKRGGSAPYLVRGIGDDCAVMRVPQGSELLVKSDQFVEGVHFLKSTAPAAALGQRALARAVSDVAAMGGWPLAYFVSLALPAWADARWVDSFYRGMNKLGIPLGGGDVTRAKALYCDVVVIGHVPQGEALRRDTARAGDVLYVSGELGAEAARKRVTFEPRLQLGRYLRENRIATACMDLSDGLAMDAARLGEESGLAVELDAVPVAKGVTVEQAFQYGEDYELLFAASATTAVPASFNGVALTKVGVLRVGRAGVVKFRGRIVKPRGWDPFSR